MASKTLKTGNQRTKILKGPLPGGIDPQEGREMDKRLPPPYVEVDPFKMNKRRKIPTPKKNKA